MYSNKKHHFPKSCYEPQNHNQMEVHLKGFHMTYWTPYNIGYWHRYGRNRVSARFAWCHHMIMIIQKNDETTFLKLHILGLVGAQNKSSGSIWSQDTVEQGFWPINHAKRTSRGRTMALSVKRAYFEEIPSFQSSGRNGLLAVSLRHHNIFQHLKMFACITHRALSFRSEQQEV